LHFEWNSLHLGSNSLLPECNQLPSQGNEVLGVSIRPPIARVVRRAPGTHAASAATAPLARTAHGRRPKAKVFGQFVARHSAPICMKFRSRFEPQLTIPASAQRSPCGVVKFTNTGARYWISLNSGAWTALTSTSTTSLTGTNNSSSTPYRIAADAAGASVVATGTIVLNVQNGN
jgi:hypothetical protein